MEHDWTATFGKSAKAGEVALAFTELLATHLPMSQGELAERMNVDRTTVNRWRRGRTFASLDHQRTVIQTVRERLAEIESCLAMVQKDVEALERVKAAYHRHVADLDEESLRELTAAKDDAWALHLRHREVLRPEDQND